MVNATTLDVSFIACVWAHVSQTNGDRFKEKGRKGTQTEEDRGPPV